MATRLIIGLGTGRCGTVSLKALLDLQKDTHATHETMLLPHKFNERKFVQYMRKVWGRKTRIVADVALWNLPYVTAILAEYPSTKFICLKREREAVIKSYMAKTRLRNHWTRLDSEYWSDEKWPNERKKRKCPYHGCYPKFNADKEEAIGLYWDYYYIISETYEKAFPKNFKIFSMEELNSRDGCEKILTFAGYEEQTIKVGIHRNALIAKRKK